MNFIFHMNMDCIYNKKSIERKLNFLKRVGAECSFCDTTLCYDIYGKQLYKTISPIKIYESTLFHTREFWKRKGFQWSDIEYDGKQFHYNNGIDRKMENYYDTIQLLGIHNLNQHKPVKITLENMNIKIPEIVGALEVKDHPVKNELYDLFYKTNINVLGINSEIMDILKNETWKTTNIIHEKKQKEKVMIQTIQKMKQGFDLCFINTKFPIWNIFDTIQFKCIIIESEKNVDQMHSILTKKDYLSFNNVFIHKEFLIQ